MCESSITGASSKQTPAASSFMVMMLGLILFFVSVQLYWLPCNSSLFSPELGLLLCCKPGGVPGNRGLLDPLHFPIMFSPFFFTSYPGPAETTVIHIYICAQGLYEDPVCVCIHMHAFILLFFFPAARNVFSWLLQIIMRWNHLVFSRLCRTASLKREYCFTECWVTGSGISESQPRQEWP